MEINPYGKYLISGTTGSEKTFLLNILCKKLEEDGRNIVYGVGEYSHAGRKRELMRQISECR